MFCFALLCFALFCFSLLCFDLSTTRINLKGVIFLAVAYQFRATLPNTYLGQFQMCRVQQCYFSKQRSQYSNAVLFQAIVYHWDDTACKTHVQGPALTDEVIIDISNSNWIAQITNVRSTCCNIPNPLNVYVLIPTCSQAILHGTYLVVSGYPHEDKTCIV